MHTALLVTSRTQYGSVLNACTVEMVGQAVRIGYKHPAPIIMCLFFVWLLKEEHNTQHVFKERRHNTWMCAGAHTHKHKWKAQWKTQFMVGDKKTSLENQLFFGRIQIEKNKLGSRKRKESNPLVQHTMDRPNHRFIKTFPPEKQKVPSNILR